MIMQQKVFNNSIFSNSLIELKGNFNYDPIVNVYFQKSNIEFEAQPKWLHYERIELKFTKNFKEGIYREYYKSGNLRREICFISIEGIDDFFAEGIEKVFYEDKDSNGNETYTILEENEYKCGERVGIWKTYSIDGGLMREDYFDEVINLGNGFSGIKQIEYYPSTSKIASINDKAYGKSYYENGDLKAEWKNQNYFKNGQYFEYHENNKLKMKVNYIDGQRDGLMLKYYDNGSLKEEWEYSNGVRKYIKKFYQNGILKSECLYDNGESIFKNEYDKNGKLKTNK